MDGIILINKEKNMSSRDVVNIVCKSLNTKKVGHTGTLDPMATGVLVIVVGKYLKLVDYLTSLNKEYEAEITLGIDTDTLDTTGKVIRSMKADIDEKDIDNCLKSFIGSYNMEVPKYSAIKVNGKKLYEYARNNEYVKLPIKKAYINSLERISNLKNNKFKIRCNVSKGTYIRSLIRDISKKLNTVGVMSKLIRIRQGKFDIKDCNTLDDVCNNNFKLLNVKEVIDFPIIEVSTDLYKKISNGVKIKNIYNEKQVCFTYNEEILAIYESDGDYLKAKRVFTT